MTDQEHFLKNWHGEAQGYMDQLRAGDPVQFRPFGSSMEPLIRSRQRVTVVPWPRDPREGDITFCRVKGRFYVHMIKVVQGPRYLIGNNKGKTNGWVIRHNLFGLVTKVED
jgi:hypothetical protein